MTYKLKCPKCEEIDSMVMELTHARLVYNGPINECTGELDWYNEEIYEAEETFYCAMYNYVSKNLNDFINNEE